MWFSRVRNKAEKNKSSSGIEKYLAMRRSLIRGPGCSIIWAPRANSIGTMKTPGWTGFLPVAQDISSNAPGRKKNARKRNEIKVCESAGPCICRRWNKCAQKGRVFIATIKHFTGLHFNPRRRLPNIKDAMPPRALMIVNIYCTSHGLITLLR